MTEYCRFCGRRTLSRYRGNREIQLTTMADYRARLSRAGCEPPPASCTACLYHLVRCNSATGITGNDLITFFAIKKLKRNARRESEKVHPPAWEMTKPRTANRPWIAEGISEQQWDKIHRPQKYEKRRSDENSRRRGQVASVQRKCRNCGAPVPARSRVCQPCNRQRKREAYKKWYKRKLAAMTPSEREVRRMLLNERQNRNRAARFAVRQCKRCGKPSQIEPKKRYCVECQEWSRKHAMFLSQRATKRWLDRQLAKGLCPCGEPRTSKFYCHACLENHRVKGRARYHRRDHSEPCVVDGPVSPAS